MKALNRDFNLRVPVRRTTSTLAVLLLFTIGSAASHSVAQDQDEFRFAGIIRDNMVLQQEKPIRIWGWAKPGANVSVTITQDQEAGEKSVLAEIEIGTRSE